MSISQSSERGASRHRSAFSVSSILSLMSGKSETPVTPIKIVRSGSDSNAEPDEVSPQVMLLPSKYPDVSSFAFNSIIKTIDTKPIASSLQTAASDVQATFTESISSLVAQQSVLVQRMQSLDVQAKHTLSAIHARTKKSEKDAELLAGSERISLIAEKNYNEVERILRLFREIDSLLPQEERIKHHKAHYDRLAPLLVDCETPESSMCPARKATNMRHDSSKAISALRSIQEQSPTQAVRSSDEGKFKSDPVKMTNASTSSDLPHAPRLRLAPRKSKSNLRLPQIRTVPPLPSTQLSTALPTVERDNLSTRSSMASHRSIMSTLSYFLRGQPSVRGPRQENMVPGQERNAEESLRKISGSSLARGRVVSAASTSGTSTRQG